MDHERVGGRRHHVLIERVAPGDLGLHLLDSYLAAVGAELGGAAARALFERGFEIDLERRVGHDDVADVAPHHHDLSAQADRALLRAHHLAHRRVARRQRHLPLDLRAAQLPSDILPVDQDGVLPAVGGCRRQHQDLQFAGQRGQRRSVARIDPALDGSPRQRAVHRAGVEIEVAEPAG